MRVSKKQQVEIKRSPITNSREFAKTCSDIIGLEEGGMSDYTIIRNIPNYDTDSKGDSE